MRFRNRGERGYGPVPPNMNCKVGKGKGPIMSKARKPYTWEALAGGVYTIRDGNGNYIDVTKLPEKGPGWFVCANAWGIPYQKFRTREEAIAFAEGLLGMRR